MDGSLSTGGVVALLGREGLQEYTFGNLRVVMRDGAFKNRALPLCLLYVGGSPMGQGDIRAIRGFGYLVVHSERRADRRRKGVAVVVFGLRLRVRGQGRDPHSRTEAGQPF